MIMKQGKKLMSVFLSTVLAFSILPSMKSSTVVNAASDKTVVSLCTNAIKAPEPGGLEDRWTGSYVWYGTYKDKEVKYRVLTPKTTEFGETSIFLDSDKMLFKSIFKEDTGYHSPTTNKNDWKNSDIRRDLNGILFLNKSGVFTDVEKNSIIPSNVNKRENTINSILDNQFSNYTALENDKIFLLDFEDVMNTEYGYSYDPGRTSEGERYSVDSRLKMDYNERNGSIYYMLRTACELNKTQYGVVDGWGRIVCMDAEEINGVCPAFNVGLSSILFSSLVSGKAGENNAEYKLTLLDDNMNILIPTGKNIKTSDKKITIPFSIKGANSSNATQASILILDKEYKLGNTNNANIIYYNKLNVSGTFSSAYNEGSFDFPNDLRTSQWGDSYHVYLIAEDVNGKKQTDYASAPLELEIPEEYVVLRPMKKYSITVYDDGNGKASSSVEKGTEDTEVTLSATPHDGYQFKEWQIISGDISITDNKFLIKKNNVEIKAIFEPIQRTVSFNANGGSGIMEKVVVENNSSFILPNCKFTAPQGKEFNGWDAGKVGESIKVTSDLEINAIWKDKSTEQNAENNKTKEKTTENSSQQVATEKKTVIDGVGTISDDGRILIDLEGVTYSISGKVTKEKLKRNALIADKKSGGKYKITKVIKKNGKVTGGTVTYMAPYNKNSKIISATGKVKLAGVTFTVTAIAPNCAKDCKNLTKVVLGDNITSIGKNAFMGCSKLKSITIKSKKLKKVGAGTFKGIHKKASISVPKIKKKAYSKLLKGKGQAKTVKIK